MQIVLRYIDFSKKEIGVGDYFMPSGDLEVDFKYIQAFYADKVGRYPHKQSPIVLRE